MDLLQALNIQVLLVDDCLLRSFLVFHIDAGGSAAQDSQQHEKNYHTSQKQCDAVGNVLAPDRIHDGREKEKSRIQHDGLGPGVNLALQIGCDPAEIVFGNRLAHHPDQQKAEQDVQKL